mmetsp:Transcript_13057/g.30899  ORF Transcript_13057/g.30899 Transcript_13057/m.30899 type:complete len:200 (+) Transcript_13057:1453-2052(+)
MPKARILETASALIAFASMSSGFCGGPVVVVVVGASSVVAGALVSVGASSVGGVLVSVGASSSRKMSSSSSLSDASSSERGGRGTFLRGPSILTGDRELLILSLSALGETKSEALFLVGVSPTGMSSSADVVVTTGFVVDFGLLGLGEDSIVSNVFFFLVLVFFDLVDLFDLVDIVDFLLETLPLEAPFFFFFFFVFAR